MPAPFIGPKQKSFKGLKSSTSITRGHSLIIQTNRQEVRDHSFYVTLYDIHLSNASLILISEAAAAAAAASRQSHYTVCAGHRRAPQQFRLLQKRLTSARRAMIKNTPKIVKTRRRDKNYRPVVALFDENLCALV